MKKSNFLPQFAAVTALIACAPLSALADESNASFMNAYDASNFYVGALLGANIPSGDFGSDNSANYGITLGAKVAPYLSVGFYGTSSGQSNSRSIFGQPVGTSSRTYNLTGELNVLFSIFHVGGDIGGSINTWSANAGSLSTSTNRTAMIYGPEAGLDIPLGTSHVSLGGEVHYLFTNDSEGQNNLQALAALKFWM